MIEATRGVLDTSALIDHDLIAAERLPDPAIPKFSANGTVVIWPDAFSAICSRRRDC
jgi:hypothetical protein